MKIAKRTFQEYKYWTEEFPDQVFYEILRSVSKFHKLLRPKEGKIYMTEIYCYFCLGEPFKSRPTKKAHKQIYYLNYLSIAISIRLLAGHDPGNIWSGPLIRR